MKLYIYEEKNPDNFIVLKETFANEFKLYIDKWTDGGVKICDTISYFNLESIFFFMDLEFSGFSKNNEWLKKQEKRFGNKSTEKLFVYSFSDSPLL